MGNLGPFNMLYNNYANDFQNLIDKINNRYSSPTSFTRPLDMVEPKAYIPTVEPPQDSYQPSNETANKTTQEENPSHPSLTQPEMVEVPEENTAPQEEAEEVPAEESQVPINPDGTYSYIRKARLDYSLDLRFDLGAFTSTVKEMADGDIESLEQIVAGGFGLHADMNFKGFQQIQATSDSELDKTSVLNGKSLANTGLAGKFGANSRNFALNSFYREASQIGRSFHVIDNGNHRMAVNKIGFRFKLDTGFNFAFLTKFNTQTTQMAQQAPDAVNSYINTAGNVAENGSSEMMATFFDAVDAYLGQAEESIIAKAKEYFNMAVEELGFSGDLVTMAKDNFIGTIKGFFSRVDSAVEAVREVYSPQVEAPATPELDASYFNPAEYSNADELAIA